MDLDVLALVCPYVARWFACSIGGSVENQFGRGLFIGIDYRGGSVLPVGYLSILYICTHRYRNLTGGWGASGYARNRYEVSGAMSS